jgi:hypothetical protein
MQGYPNQQMMMMPNGQQMMMMPNGQPMMMLQPQMEAPAPAKGKKKK